MVSKLKKLIIITDPLFVRNYIQTNAFEKILDDDTHIACIRGIASEEIIKKYWNFSGDYSVSKINEELFSYVSMLLMYENRKLNKGFYFYFKRHNITVYYKSIKLKKIVSRYIRNKFLQVIIIQILELLRPFRQFKKLLVLSSIITISSLGLTKLLLNIYRYFLPLNYDLDQIMLNVQPDLVLIPNGGLDSAVAEVMNLSSKKYNYKTMLLIDNWDNLCGKSRFAFSPDFLSVWGEQAKGHAINFQGFDSNKVYLAGTPRFDVYTKYKTNKLYKNLANKTNKSLIGFPYILFAGCWPKFDEIEVLELLNTLVERFKNDLPEGCKILYRPHPWGENYDYLDLLESKKLQHIAIDPQMSHKSRPDDYRRRSDFQPQLDYYPALLEKSEFVICPLSTIIIEASIMKKNILILAHDDKKNFYNPYIALKNSDYFDRLEEMKNNIFLHKLDELDKVFYEMITSNLYTNNQALNYYIVSDGTFYPDRIKKICDSLPL